MGICFSIEEKQLQQQQQQQQLLQKQDPLQQQFMKRSQGISFRSIKSTFICLLHLWASSNLFNVLLFQVYLLMMYLYFHLKALRLSVIYICSMIGQDIILKRVKMQIIINGWHFYLVYIPLKISPQ